MSTGGLVLPDVSPCTKEEEGTLGGRKKTTKLPENKSKREEIEGGREKGLAVVAARVVVAWTHCGTEIAKNCIQNSQL